MRTFSRTLRRPWKSLWRDSVGSNAYHPLWSRLRRLYSSISAAELQFGQPLHETHPHLLKAGEITPGITALEYCDRRTKLAKELPDNGIAIVAASDIKYRCGAAFYEFHQDPSFFYLTGFNEPEAAAVIEKTGRDGQHIFHLFVRPKDPKAELWDGARSGVQAALDVFNADEADSVDSIHGKLPRIVAGAGEIYTDISGGIDSPSQLNKLLYGPSMRGEGFINLFERSTVRPLQPLLNKFRMFKSEAEIANMRRAGRASGRAITNAMRQKFSGEKELSAFLDYQFKMEGCDATAYIPVVAGGEHALSIHYVRNDDTFRNGELVLVDAGGEYGGYITDITRCWPLSGKFSPAQKELYETILGVQRSCISLCRQDANVSLDKLHTITENGLKDGLKQIGFDMSGKALETLFPHHVGHYIGLEIHDTGAFSRKESLRSGQCVTVEPGVYVPDDDRWPKHFRGLGIRIEDSVCVQEENPLVLTTEAVKEVVDIEAVAAV
ncbi:MAG: hypothetical protein M1837_003698 [Sclerophora amabilis]|nr:MAG: hypothetical protein M1837_003698 [Sclerophora amabilis]